MDDAMRQAILQRDQRCMTCGAHGVVRLEVGHLLARSKGGSDTFDNLIAQCRPCNVATGTKDISALFPRQFVYHISLDDMVDHDVGSTSSTKGT